MASHWPSSSPAGSATTGRCSNRSSTTSRYPEAVVAPGFNADAYKDRNVVERSFALVKQWRGIATRYDKLAIAYRAGAVLHACLTWATVSGDAP